MMDVHSTYCGNHFMMYGLQNLLFTLNLGSIPGSGRSAGEGNSNSLWYLCLENPMERGAWWARIHGVAQSQTGLSMYMHLKPTLCYISVASQ